ncbi:MAG: hypothetical protein ABL903_06000 [Methylococcales bacterium]
MTEWPNDVKSKIDNLREKIGKYGKSGDWVNAEKLYFEAWALIPGHKHLWSDSQWLLLEIFELYEMMGELGKFSRFLTEMEKAYPEGKDDGTVAVISGMVYFENGQLDSAYERFDYLFKSFKKRPFQGREKKYLDFYLKESVVRKKNEG